MDLSPLPLHSCFARVMGTRVGGGPLSEGNSGGAGELWRCGAEAHETMWEGMPSRERVGECCW